MDLGRQAASRLKSWGSFSGEPRILAVTGDRFAIAAEVRAADSLGCSLAEVRLRSLQSLQLGLEQLRNWGARLSKRIRYLLEALETLEVDEAAGRLLLRSSPPETKPDGAVFTMRCCSRVPGSFCFAGIASTPQRASGPMRRSSAPASSSKRCSTTWRRQRLDTSLWWIESAFPPRRKDAKDYLDSDLIEFCLGLIGPQRAGRNFENVFPDALKQ